MCGLSYDSIGQSRTALAGRKDCRIIPVRDSQYIMRSDWSPCVTTTESELHHFNTCKLWSQADGIGRLCTIVQLISAHFHRLKSGITDDNHRAIEPSSWNILLSASIQGTCSVSLSMIFWVRLQVANRLDLRFVYIWVISFHLNMIFVSCFIYFGPRFCHISNTLQGLVKDFEAGCCSRIVWSACQRPGVALFHSSKALSSHCSLARCFRCALRKRVFWTWTVMLKHQNEI